MEIPLKQLDIKQELKIKEEVCFELTEDESLIVGINNENVIESEMKEVDLTQVQDGWKTKDVKIEQIKEEGSNDAGLDDDKDSLQEQEEQEIDCEWSEDVENEQDPLANLDVKYKGESLYTEEDPVKFVSSPSRKDAEDTSPAQHSLEFRVFLVNAQTGLYIQESRNLQFWFSTELPENQQATVAQEFFKELVSPQEFPRDYVGFIKKMTKLMQHKYQGIWKLKIILRQLDQSHAIPTRSYLEPPRRKAVPTHDEEMEPYKCEECVFFSSSLIRLKKHLRKHPRSSYYKWRENLERRTHHIRPYQTDHTYSANRPYKCKECSYVCNYLESLERHMRVHSANRPYKCKECSYVCNSLESLERHMRVHSANRPYKCKKCSYVYNYPESLERHMRVHSANRPYKCKKCEYSFDQLSSLRQHVRRHGTINRPHKCNKCECSFDQLSSLRKHVRRHGTINRPHKCNKCECSFDQLSLLKQHVRRRHTINRPHKCNKCECSYANLSSLKRHVVTHSVKKTLNCTEHRCYCFKLSNFEAHMKKPDKLSNK